MADIKFKRVYEESFSDVAMYLEYVLSITKEMGIPCFIEMDGRKYFVTRVRNDKGFLYACSYEKDGKLKSFGLSVPDDNPEYVSLTDGVTIYRDFSTVPEHPFVIKENVVNSNTEQVALGTDREGDPCLVYYQQDLNRNMDCEIIYNLKGFNSILPAYLNYIHTKYPKSIIIGEDKKLFKVINHRSTEVYRYDKSQYLVPTIKIFGVEFANANKKYDLDDVLYNVRLNGFNSCIPEQISDVLIHKSEVENNMKKLAKIYDENLVKIQ